MVAEISETNGQAEMTPLERKMARKRSPLLSQEVLDRVVREHAAYFRALANERGMQPLDGKDCEIAIADVSAPVEQPISPGKP